MTILHFLPRIQKEPEISDDFKKITGKKPTTLKEFLELYTNSFDKNGIPLHFRDSQINEKY